MQLPPEMEELGRRGEDRRRRELHHLLTTGEVKFYCRPEWIVATTSGLLYFDEVKTQSRFEKPPYDGHGLPVLQVERYIALHDMTGFPTLLTIYDADEPVMFRQWVHVLQDGDHFDTAGTRRSPRRVYPLTSYRRYELSQSVGDGVRAVA